jgi:hypothetical protein
LGKRLNWIRSSLYARISPLVEPLPLDTTERIRLHQFSVFLLTGIPTMVVFGVYHLVRGNHLLGLMACVVSGCLGASRLLLGRMQSGLTLYRINAFLFAGLLLYLLTIGGEGGSKALWMFVFPLIVFFLFGTLEGLAWSLAIYLAALSLFAGGVNGLPAYPYRSEFATRFSMTYWIIVAICYWFEFLRQHYRRGMEEERRRLVAEQARLREEIDGRLKAEGEREALIHDLQEAVSKVKLLRGLLPICSSCKKIRDDRGQWVQIESYVRERSDAEFSHSICPDCGEAMYHGLLKEQ